MLKSYGWVVAHKILETAQSPNYSFPLWAWTGDLGLGLGLVNIKSQTLSWRAGSGARSVTKSRMKSLGFKRKYDGKVLFKVKE